MGRSKKPEKPSDQKDLEQALKDARSKGSIDEAIDVMFNNLKLERYFKSSSTRKYREEALLIEVAKKDFDADLDTDVILNALDLLVAPGKLSRQTSKGAITERRELFIKKSSYIEDKYRKNSAETQKYTSYKEVALEGDKKLEKVISDLGNYDKKLLEQLGGVLWSHKDEFDGGPDKSEGKYDYIEASEKYFEYDDGRIKGLILPELSCEGRGLIIRRLLRHLHSPESEQEFRSESPQTWKQLELEGNPGAAVFKTFVIGIINREYDPTKPDEAKKRDVLLLALNLLKGYSQENTKENLDDLLTARYRNYLKNSDYLKILNPDHNKIKSNLFDVDIGQLNDFKKFVQSCIDELIDKILQIRRDGKLESKISQYAEGNVELLSALQEPCYTIKAFPPKLPSPKPPPHPIVYRHTISLTLALVLLLPTANEWVMKISNYIAKTNNVQQVTVQDYYAEENPQEKEEPKNEIAVEEIKIAEKTPVPVVLTQGKSTSVFIEFKPEYANRQASCSSSNLDALHVDYTPDTGEVFLRAEMGYDLDGTDEQVTVTIIPRTRVSSKVYESFTVSIEKSTDFIEVPEADERDGQSVIFPL